MMLKKILISLVLAVLLSAAYTVYSATESRNELQENLLRFHILANSDSEKDQEVKRFIRDEIASLCSFLELNSRDEVISAIEGKFTEIEQVATEILLKNGLDYAAKAEIKEVHFPVREYGAWTIPAGKYLSFVLSLGEAKGANWWCVMYPPLCYADEKVVNEEELEGFFIENLSKQANELISSESPRVVYKIKLLEWLEKEE